MTIVRHIIDPATGQAFFVTPDNPSTIGLDGPIGSLANMAGGGRLFSKFGAAVTDWQEFAPVTTGGTVNSVFGRTGNVIAQSGDYTFAQIGSKPTTIGGYGITDAMKRYGRVTSDLNTLLVGGDYGLDASNANLIGTAYGSLLVVDNSDVGLQIVGGYTQDSLYFRGWYNSGANFTPWRTVLHSGNYGSYALPLAGGTMLGALTAQMIDIQAGYGLRGPNGAFILARNAANTAYVDLLYMNSSDVAVIPRSLQVSGRLYNTYSVAEDNPFVTSNGSASGYGAYLQGGGGGGRYALHVVRYDGASVALFGWNNSYINGDPGGSETFRVNGSGRFLTNLVVGGNVQALNHTIAGNTNPYIYFLDGTYGAYWQMASGEMGLYHNGSNRIIAPITGGTLKVANVLQNMAGAGGPGWWQLAQSSSPALTQFQFGTDGSGYAYEIGSNKAGVYTARVRVYDETYNGGLWILSNQGFFIGAHPTGVASMRYGSILSGTFDLLNNSDGYAGLLVGNVTFSNGPLFAYWNQNYIQMSPGSGQTAGGIIMYNGAVRGYLYMDTSGFGLLHSGGSWLLKNPYGTLDLEVGSGSGSIKSYRFVDWTTGAFLAPVIVSTSAPSTSAPNGTLWIQVTS